MTTRLISLAGHGDIAAGVKSAADLIVGQRGDLRTAPPYTGDTDELRAHVEGLLEEIGEDGSLVLVTDLLGGSVSNTLLNYQDDRRVQHFTGMTLALVLELVTADPTDDEGRFPAAFVERIRTAVTPLPLRQQTTNDEDF
jgi:fructoselysine and glucoselysine-specific PTS system IIA component